MVTARRRLSVVLGEDGVPHGIGRHVVRVRGTPWIHTLIEDSVPNVLDHEVHQPALAQQWRVQQIFGLPRTAQSAPSAGSAAARRKGLGPGDAWMFHGLCGGASGPLFQNNVRCIIMQAVRVCHRPLACAPPPLCVCLRRAGLRLTLSRTVVKRRPSCLGTAENANIAPRTNSTSILRMFGSMVRCKHMGN